MYMAGHYVASAVIDGESHRLEEAFAERNEAIRALRDACALSEEVAHRVARDGFADTQIGTLALAEVYACDCEHPETHRTTPRAAMAGGRELLAVGRVRDYNCHND